MKEKKQLYFLFEMMLDENDECYCFNPIKDNMNDMDPKELENIGVKLINKFYSEYKIKISEVSSVLVNNDNLRKKYFNFYNNSNFIKIFMELSNKNKFKDYSIDKLFNSLSNKFSENIKKVFFNDYEEDKQLIEIKLDYAIDKETLEVIYFYDCISIETKIDNNIFMILIAYIYYILRYKEKNQRLYFISLSQYMILENGNIKFKTFDMFTCNILDKVVIEKYQIDEILIEYLDWCVCKYNNNLNTLLYENPQESCNNFSGDYKLISKLIN